jgi:hypothetical protein
MCTPRQEATSPRAVASPKVSAQGTRQEAKVLTLPHASPSRLPCSPGGTARRSTSQAEVAAFGGVNVAGIRSSERIRSQPNAEASQMERAQKIAMQ